MVLFPGCKCCGDGCGGCCEWSGNGQKLHLMNNGKQAAQATANVTVGDSVTLGPGRFDSMEVIDSPVGRVVLEKYWPGDYGDPDTFRTEIFLEPAGEDEFDDPSCQPAIAAWGDESRYEPRVATNAWYFDGHISGNVRQGRFLAVLREVFFADGLYEVGYVKQVNFGGFNITDPSGNVVFAPSHYEPNIVTYQGEQVFRVANSDWSGPVTVTVTITHNYHGQPITPEDFTYELDIPTLFQLQGCEECGDPKPPAGPCFGSPCEGGEAQTLWESTTVDNYTDSFLITGPTINSDSQTPTATSLGLEYDDGAGSTWHMWFGGPTFELNHYSPTNGGMFRLRGGCGSADNAPGFTFLFLEGTSMDAGTVKHYALDGTVTEWVNPPAGVYLKLPEDEDSPFFTGRYEFTTFHGEVLNIELRGTRQLLRKIIDDCPTTPCKCSAGTCEKYTSVTISQQQVYFDPPEIWNCDTPQIMAPETVDVPAYGHINRDCVFYEEACEWEIRDVPEKEDFFSPGNWRFDIWYSPTGSYGSNPPPEKLKGYILAQYNPNPDGGKRCSPFFYAYFEFSPCVFAGPTAVRAYFRGDEATYPFYYTDLTIEAVNQELP